MIGNTELLELKTLNVRNEWKNTNKSNQKQTSHSGSKAAPYLISFRKLEEKLFIIHVPIILITKWIYYYHYVRNNNLIKHKLCYGSETIHLRTDLLFWAGAIISRQNWLIEQRLSWLLAFIGYKY